MLSNWLSPVVSESVSPYFTKSFSCQGNFPDLKDAKIVVFSRASAFSDQVRKAIGQLHRHFDATFIDIGTMNTSNASSAYQVLSELQDGHVLPILLGVEIATFKEFCTAMQKEERLHTCAFISNQVEVGNGEVNFENIGYQRHYIPKHQYAEVIDSSTPGLSLGALRSNQRILEPILRECNYIHFDLGALRRSEMPTLERCLPTGLNCEEACQIMRYAGEGSRLKMITMDSSSLGADASAEAMVVAELLWYLHEGVELRNLDHPAISNDFKEYIIELNDVDHSMIFTQSNKSGKWWLKLQNDSNKYVSCAYEEYQQTIEHEIPTRLLNLM